MAKVLNDISFLEILPSSISGDDGIKAAAQALDGELKSVLGEIGNLDLYGAISELPEAIIKHLAWQWHVDAWDDNLTPAQKAAFLDISYRWHRIKGTPAAVEMILNDVLGGGKVEEFWEYGGEEFHFRVFANDPPEDDTAYAVLIAGIDSAKNTRSVLDDIIKPASITSNLYHGGIISAGATVTVYQE
jgi:phage tail P2-like protein